MNTTLTLTDLGAAIALLNGCATRQCRTSGSVRGVPSTGHPYRNHRRLSGRDGSRNAPVNEDGEALWQDLLADEWANPEAEFGGCRSATHTP
jgi:hypothetical protein